MSQPPSYSPPPPGTFPPAAAPPPGNGIAVAALVLGLIALLCSPIPVVNFLGLLLALIGLGLGIAGIRRGRRVGRGTALAGWGTGLSALALVISVVMTFIVIRYLGDLLDTVDPPEPSAKIGETFETDDGDLEIKVTSVECVPDEDGGVDAGERCSFTFTARNRSDRTIYLDAIRVKAVVDGQWDDPYLEGDQDLAAGASGTITGSTTLYAGRLDGIAFDADDASSHSAVVVDAGQGQ